MPQSFDHPVRRQWAARMGQRLLALGVLWGSVVVPLSLPPLLLLTLSGCGFQPVYGGGPSSPVRSRLAQVEVLRIDDQIGQQLRNALEQKMNQGRPSVDKAYQLNVKVTRSTRDLTMGKDQFSSRSELVVDVSYELRQQDHVLVAGTASGRSSYNILDQQYATVMSQKDSQENSVQQVAEDITRRLSSFFATQGK